jgi:hypothetical protein
MSTPTPKEERSAMIRYSSTKSDLWARRLSKLLEKDY